MRRFFGFFCDGFFLLLLVAVLLLQVAVLLELVAVLLQHVAAADVGRATFKASFRQKSRGS